MRKLIWVLAAGALLRIVLQFLWSPELGGDAADYDRLARGLVAGEGLLDARGAPTSFRPPLYPLYVAFWYRLISPGTAAVMLSHIVLDLGTTAVVFLLARRWASERAALLAAGLVALNVASISATGRLLSESLFTLLLVSGVWLGVRWNEVAGSERPAFLRAAFAGTVFGLAVLTRGVLLPYAPLLVAASAVVARRIIPGTSIFVVAFLATLAPWTVRNFRVHGALVPVTTQVGITLYAGFAPPGGVFGLQPYDSIVRSVEQYTEVEQSRVLTLAALELAASDPARTAVLEARKAVYFWSPVDWEILPRYGMFNPTYAWTVLLALLFMATGHRSDPTRRRHLWPVWAPVLFVFGMALLFHGSPRYRLPIEPLLAILAASGVSALVERVGTRRTLWTLSGLASTCLIATVLSDPLRAWVGAWVR